MVAAATTTLCDAANAAVQGNASEERLIAGAKQVSNSTAQLLLACRVKADSNSDTQRRLQVSDGYFEGSRLHKLGRSAQEARISKCKKLPCWTKRKETINFHKKKKKFSAINPSVSFSYGVSLQIAGNAVKRAADNLVTAAKSAAIFEEQETTVVINQRFVGGIAQELEAQEKILRIEKELAAARNKLSQIRQAKYRPEEDD